jgi:hypothetical protein
VDFNDSVLNGSHLDDPYEAVVPNFCGPIRQVENGSQGLTNSLWLQLHSLHLHAEPEMANSTSDRVLKDEDEPMAVPDTQLADNGIAVEAAVVLRLKSGRSSRNTSLCGAATDSTASTCNPTKDVGGVIADPGLFYSAIYLGGCDPR